MSIAFTLVKYSDEAAKHILFESCKESYFAFILSKIKLIWILCLQLLLRPFSGWKPFQYTIMRSKVIVIWDSEFFSKFFGKEKKRCKTINPKCFSYEMNQPGKNKIHIRNVDFYVSCYFYSKTLCVVLMSWPLPMLFGEAIRIAVALVTNFNFHYNRII